MKIYTYKTLLIAIITLLSFSACESYLDVESDGIVKEDDLFKNIEGHVDAMFGVYASLTENDLYGSNLSYGFIDELAQLYTNAPTGVINVPLDKTTQYLYRESEVMNKVDAIWVKSYKTISYVNNVIEHLEGVDLSSNLNYPLIKGEAHAIRAFLHFDISRMFCETITQNPSARGVPYSVDFDLELPELHDLSTTYDLILNDLSIAEEALVNDFDSVQINDNPFNSERTLHLNKYAVWAVKSRVYLWKGDMQNAALYAEKVINSGQFSLYNDNDLADNMRYPATKETIWAVFNNTKYDHIFNKFLFEDVIFNSNLQFQYVAVDIKKLYEISTFTSDNTDVRYSAYFLPSQAHRKNIFRKLLDYPTPIAGTNRETKDEIEGFTLIRLPEMYYIAAEGLYDVDFAKAKQYFNKVRNSRGLANIEEGRIDTKQKFVNELLLEKNKELWGEGQLFLEYKRLNKDIVGVDDKIYSASNDIYVLPLPENEVEFGN